MSKNNEKFKLQEDPEVAGGAKGDWNYCPICGTSLRGGYCRKCERDYLGSGSDSDDGLFSESGGGYQEMDVPTQNTKSRRTRNRSTGINQKKILA